jgi:hypothetical protein
MWRARRRLGTRARTDPFGRATNCLRAPSRTGHATLLGLDEERSLPPVFVTGTVVSPHMAWLLDAIPAPTSLV